MKRWQQPFDEFDIEQIENQTLSLNQIKGYLLEWARENPEQYRQLKEADTRIEPDHKTGDPLAILEGLELLPEDKAFIKRHLPINRKDQVLKEYRKQWTDAANQNSGSISRANAGRRAANTWLRAVVKDQQHVTA